MMTPARGSTIVPPKMDMSVVRRNFNRWNDALSTHNPAAIAALYAHDATFFPTLSREFVKTQLGAEEYFRMLAKREPCAVMSQEEVHVCAADCYLHSGIYTFTFGQEGSGEPVVARFTFAWRRNEAGEWQIIHHHSSRAPEAV